MYEFVEPSQRMVRQELAMSCGAACARQLLRDAGIDVAEAVIREHAQFDPEHPIWAPDLVRALDRLHPGAVYEALSLDPTDLPAILARGSFLALLKVGRGKHWVIVDGITEALVHIRDPAGTSGDETVGAAARMSLDRFRERWRLAINYVVYRRA